MYNERENPWLQMSQNTARRVDLVTAYNFFWICDNQGNFGLMIHFSFPLYGDLFIGKMKGISVATIENDGKLYLILQDQKEWEMFLSVCNDVLLYAIKSKDEEDMISSINQRLKRWRKFLSEDNSFTIPEKVQMGLFAELKFIEDKVIPAIGYKDAIIGWVGPDADQKDFSLIDYFLEIKSFMSSKGQNVMVSSVGQLDDEIKPVYLVAYALSRTENGVNIPLLVSKIHKQIPSGDIQIKSIFEEKLAAYGYYLDITKPPFSNYTVDSVQSYLIQDSFPRIKSTMLDSRISKVRYSINLGQCDMYKDKLPF